jgi:hypothetical protein
MLSLAVNLFSTCDECSHLIVFHYFSNNIHFIHYEAQFLSISHPLSDAYADINEVISSVISEPPGLFILVLLLRLKVRRLMRLVPVVVKDVLIKLRLMIMFLGIDSKRPLFYIFKFSCLDSKGYKFIVSN